VCSLGPTVLALFRDLVTAKTIDVVILLNLYSGTLHELALQSKKSRPVSVADVHFMFFTNYTVVLVSNKFVL